MRWVQGLLPIPTFYSCMLTLEAAVMTQVVDPVHPHGRPGFFLCPGFGHWYCRHLRGEMVDGKFQFFSLFLKENKKKLQDYVIEKSLMVWLGAEFVLNLRENPQIFKWLTRPLWSCPVSPWWHSLCFPSPGPLRLSLSQRPGSLTRSKLLFLFYVWQIPEPSGCIWMSLYCDAIFLSSCIFSCSPWQL